MTYAAFKATVSMLTDLLEMHEVSTDHPDTQQTIINAAVVIDNAYHGYQS